MSHNSFNHQDKSPSQATSVIIPKHNRFVNSLKSALLLFLAFLTTISPASALSSSTLDFYAQNGILFYNPDGKRGCYTSTLSGNTNFAKIVDYFSGNNEYGVSLSAEGIAGIIANFYHESGLSAFRNQGQFSSKAGIMTANNGYGIAQFTPRTKVLNALKTDLRTAGYFNEYYNAKYGSADGIADDGIPEGIPDNVNDAWLAVELDYIVTSELTVTKIGNYRNSGGVMGLDYIPSNYTILDALNIAKTASDAARIFIWIYERPADKPGGAIARSAKAEEILPEVRALLGNSSTPLVTDTDDGSNVTIIGDSITVNTEQGGAFKDVLPNADIYAKVSKQFYHDTNDNPSGYSILQDLVSSNQLRDNLIFALGTNSQNITAKQAQDIVDLAGPERTVIFVTNFTTSSDYLSNNNVFAKVKNDNKNVVIADWKSIIESDPEHYLSDGVHPNAAGRTAFANLLASAVGMNKTSLNACPASGHQGMTEEQAKAFAAYYKSDAVSASEWYLPANTKWNCVSLSAYFVERFTTIGAKKRRWGDGGYTAYYLAKDFNLESGTEPRPYAIFSVPHGNTICDDGLPCGHTGVVLAVNGNSVTTIEAAYGRTGYTEVLVHDISYFDNARFNAPFTYTDSILKTDELDNFIKELGV